MKEENKKHIDEFVKGIKTVDIANANIKALNEAINIWNEKGEEEYRKIYTSSSYNFKELQYFRRELRKRKRVLKEEETKFKEELRKALCRRS